MKSKIITTCILVVIVITTTILAVNVNEEKHTKFNIVTSFYPMYVATLNVTDGIDSIEVSNLTYQTTGCIHDYVLTTSELVTLSKADVLVINGAGMEGFMDKVISNFDDLDIIDASSGIKLIYNECEQDEHYEHEEHLGHNHETNPHIFVSVKNYIKQVQNICDALVKIDCLNKEKYEANTKTYISKLEELEKEVNSTMLMIKDKDIVTFHNTFDYFANDYGLNVVGVIENEHGKTPSAGEIGTLIENIKSEGVRAIFVEPEYSLKLVDMVAKDTEAKVYMLNPITSGDNNKDEYINIMRENLSVLKEALSGKE